MPLKFGPDISNYQSWLDQEDVRKLVEYQVSFVAIGRQHTNRWAQQQYDMFAQAGVDPKNIFEYLISLRGVWPNLFPTTRFVAIDVEPGSEFDGEADIDSGIEWVRSVGRTPIIYSSAWAWEALGLQALTKYGEQGIPLWNAHYDGKTDGLVLPTPFGGWTRCAIDQYTDKWNDGGFLEQPIDMNDAEDFFEDPAPPIIDSRITRAYALLGDYIKERGG